MSIIQLICNDLFDVKTNRLCENLGRNVLHLDFLKARFKAKKILGTEDSKMT